MHSWGSQGKNTEVVCHSLLQWTTFCLTSPLWPIHLGWPHTAWLSFIKLDKVVVHVIRLACCLWLWFQSVCLLMPSLSAYHLSWVSLILEVGYLFMAAPANQNGKDHCLSCVADLSETDVRWLGGRIPMLVCMCLPAIPQRNSPFPHIWRLECPVGFTLWVASGYLCISFKRDATESFQKPLHFLKKVKVNIFK